MSISIRYIYNICNICSIYNICKHMSNSSTPMVIGKL